MTSRSGTLSLIVAQNGCLKTMYISTSVSYIELLLFKYNLFVFILACPGDNIIRTYSHVKLMYSNDDISVQWLLKRNSDRFHTGNIGETPLFARIIITCYL